MKIIKSHGSTGIALTIPNEYPTTQEVEAWLNLLNTMKASNYYILGKGCKLEFFGCVECDLRNWIRQKRYYNGWFKRMHKVSYMTPFYGNYGGMKIKEEWRMFE